MVFDVMRMISTQMLITLQVVRTSFGFHLRECMGSSLLPLPPAPTCEKQQHISLRSLHDIDVKLLNLTYYGECERKTTIFLFFFLKTVILNFRTQLPEKSLTFDNFSVMNQKR